MIRVSQRHLTGVTSVELRWPTLTHRSLRQDRPHLLHLYRHTHTHTHARETRPNTYIQQQKKRRLKTHPLRRVSVRHSQRPVRLRSAEQISGFGERLAAWWGESLTKSFGVFFVSRRAVTRPGVHLAPTLSPVCLRDRITEELSFFRVGRFVIRINQPRMWSMRPLSSGRALLLLLLICCCCFTLRRGTRCNDFFLGGGSYLSRIKNPGPHSLPVTCIWDDTSVLL